MAVKTGGERKERRGKNEETDGRRYEIKEKEESANKVGKQKEEVKKK